jgi:hypothetical protein
VVSIYRTTSKKKGIMRSQGQKKTWFHSNS